ncbi:hypothetical protein ACIO8H_12125 [Streptomyces sp. NPDC087226]|uniref:hypothetical protein n=1 Tax=Streptomyces sp. NPDC087226 TaxID=3365771 RepID=UPI00380406D5
MGERQNDGGPAGRRRAHPEGTPSGRRGPGAATAGPDLEALLAAALISEGVDAGAEQRAVAAFLAAREAGAQGARTRRRDDWRTRGGRLGRRSLKATLSVLIAGLTLSGVAVAGIGAAGGPSPDEPARDVSGTRAPSSGTATPSAGGSTAPETGSPRPGRPATAKDTEAHCRAYDRVQGRGKALDSTVWERLVEAAGGAADVGAYCAERLETDAPSGQPGNEGDGRSGRNGNGPTGDPGADTTGNEGSSGNQGNSPDGTTGNPGKPEKPGNPGAGRP